MNTKNNNDIYNNIIDSIDKLYKKYNFINLSQNEFYNIIKNKLVSIYNIDNTQNIEYYKNQIEIYIKEYIKTELLNYDSQSQIICDYINKNIVYNEKYEDNIKQLNKISKFLLDIKFIPNPDLYIEIINNNVMLQNILKSIIDKNIKAIENNKIESIITEDISLSFIQTYCMINNINQINTYNEEEMEEIYDNINENDDYALDTVKQFLKQLQPVLTPDEERKLAIEIKKGNIEAKNMFIERNLKLVVTIAKYYKGKGLPFPDLIQEGSIGLMTAVEKYDINKGFKFSTYATHWIRQSMKRAIENNARNIRIPSYLHHKLNKYKLTHSNLQKILKREPTLSEIADEMKISYTEASELCRLENNDTISMNKIIGEDKTELEYYIQDSSNNTPEKDVIKDIMGSEIRELLEKCNLNEREKDIIKSRYGLENTEVKTLEEISKKYNVTRERIRQIESKSLQKIRQYRHIKKYADYIDYPERAKENIVQFKENYNSKNYCKKIQNNKVVK